MSALDRLETVLQLADLAVCRLRGGLLRMRGLRNSGKLTVGRHCRVNNPAGVSIGFRAKIEDQVYLKLVHSTSKCSIGEQVFIGKGVEINVELDVSIGDHVLIAPGVFIVDHNHQIDKAQRINQQPCASAKITISDDVWIGANAVLLAGVTIGQGAVVAAGAVVNSDVEPFAIVGGVPAVKIGQRP